MSHYSRSEIERRIRELGPWFHNMELDGVQTAPDHFLGDYPSLKWRNFKDAVPQDLSGFSVLDIGCNAGFYSLQMKKRGAERVVGIDSDPDYLSQARLAAEVCEADIEFRHLSVYEVDKLGERFDLVLFMGVLYHLRYPLLALDLLHRYVTRNLLICQSLLRGPADNLPIEEDYPFTESDIFEKPGFPRMSFIEHQYSHDPTNWWIPNTACLQAMLRSSGYEILAHPEPEVFMCRHVPTANGIEGGLPWSKP